MKNTAMKQIECRSLDRSSYTIAVLSYSIGGMLLSMWLAVHFRMQAMAWIGPVLFLLPPGLFTRRFQMPFTKRTLLVLGDDRLTVQTYASDESVTQRDMPLIDIGYFRVYWQPKQNTIYFSVYLKDGRSYKYFFMDDGESERRMVDTVFNYFKNFNLSRTDPQHRIKIRPSAYNVRSGRIWLWCLSSLCVITTAILLINHLTKEVTLPLILLGMIWAVWLGERIVDGRMNKKLEG